jgi:hypothetical protein
MPLELESEQKVLIGREGLAIIHFTDSTFVLVSAQRHNATFPHPVQSAHALNRVSFGVKIGQLSNAKQTEIRNNIDRIQQQFHDRATQRRESRGGPIHDVPTSVVIPDGYKFYIHHHMIRNRYPCLEVGRQVIISPDRPYHQLKYKLGTIKSFTLL